MNNITLLNMNMSIVAKHAKGVGKRVVKGVGKEVAKHAKGVGKGVGKGVVKEVVESVNVKSNKEEKLLALFKQKENKRSLEGPPPTDDIWKLGPSTKNQLLKHGLKGKKETYSSTLKFENHDKIECKNIEDELRLMDICFTMLKESFLKNNSYLDDVFIRSLVYSEKYKIGIEKEIANMIVYLEFGKNLSYDSYFNKYVLPSIKDNNITAEYFQYAMTKDWLELQNLYLNTAIYNEFLMCISNRMLHMMYPTMSKKTKPQQLYIGGPRTIMNVNNNLELKFSQLMI